MREITIDKNLIAFCGLYCAACSRYIKKKCPGCSQNKKAAWCRVRACCLERGYGSCADCTDFREARECGTFNNFMARIFGFIFRSDRAACIAIIRAEGYEAFARDMAVRRARTIPR
ncbi:MAG TPA: DUF3795 domain-containing protein [Spirochaetota bacterium]|nr:DUF3795 domain-containing protein [Spirochaetota bacterium]HPC42082.1 DUF3795 domain-containing protein [Spirochaetota bacterium]HPL18491.1 DUF3795 domain-containing protein [Spirochaetota bacterium]HQF09036.1 DUF3795 domain-containing protein [Spirochaetota bacterium]HQH97924.1 DUF3795 domain-containing protein [Spirochaetota bacterium]